ncbi:TlyA family RNA methyltransferase [Mycetocola reblochoni]|uniref:RNA binding methyltransferase FtsJ like n=2 Tax=Mycetocola reblochoni TaxID=331618 RepID=A0A1R4J0A5_9MICO|nr:TlyA family RNA methyltransferase [Mycetocola reblochoni]RLP68808.1 TlyA family RNA methyltransferase [Mycetocola reblochoni]SJN25185.1 RNA binding methyltransferase FtsJ like [Mycetocola reblochoni REB411]
MTRLDTEVAARGLARSRARATELIRSGGVEVNGSVAVKPSLPVGPDDEVRVTGDDGDVSRAAGKLRAALDAAALPVDGRVVVDAGASTGGFTQVLLERGAAAVVAIDVGHDQLAPSIAADPRVVVVEGFNVKELSPSSYGRIAAGLDRPSLIVADLSFISLTHVLGAFDRTIADEPAARASRGDGRATEPHGAVHTPAMVLLIKPQFEVGKGNLSNGIVLDRRRAEDAVRSVLTTAADRGWLPQLLILSPVVGTHGNQEYLTVLRRAETSDPEEWATTVDEKIMGAR